jgi:hypothetical protein
MADQLHAGDWLLIACAVGLGFGIGWALVRVGRITATEVSLWRLRRTLAQIEARKNIPRIIRERSL